MSDRPNRRQSYAQEAVFKDWQKAAKNVSKAAEVLHLFIDDSIDLQLPFATVRQQALSLLTKGIWNLYVSS